MKMSGEKAIHRQELERGLLTQKISRLFLKYTIPGVAGLLFLGIQSVIDGVILGRFVGANALASVNLILPCYSLMTALSIVIGVGCQTLIGINRMTYWLREPWTIFVPLSRFSLYYH